MTKALVPVLNPHIPSVWPLRETLSPIINPCFEAKEISSKNTTHPNFAMADLKVTEAQSKYDSAVNKLGSGDKKSAQTEAHAARKLAQNAIELLR